MTWHDHVGPAGSAPQRTDPLPPHHHLSTLNFLVSLAYHKKTETSMQKLDQNLGIHELKMSKFLFFIFSNLAPFYLYNIEQNKAIDFILGLRCYANKFFKDNDYPVCNLS